MNCEQISRFPCPGNEFLPTAYSPNQPDEQLANDSNPSITAAFSRVVGGTYSQGQTVKHGGGEQLLAAFRNELERSNRRAQLGQKK